MARVKEIQDERKRQAKNSDVNYEKPPAMHIL